MVNGEEVFVTASSIVDGLSRRARRDQAEQFIPELHRWRAQEIVSSGEAFYGYYSSDASV
jgi:hypothetical protein